eukprot:COSAG01_NODE_5543_length_4195_cov_1.542725_6_plen_27_part_01
MASGAVVSSATPRLPQALRHASSAGVA